MTTGTFKPVPVGGLTSLKRQTMESELEYTFEPDERSKPFLKYLDAASEKYKLPKYLLHNIARVESNFNPNAKSPKGAVGLMQIMPNIHPDVDPTDPEASADYAAKYIRELRDRFGTYDKAIAAYNMGPTALGKHGLEAVMSGKPGFYDETREYVRKVNEARVVGSEALTKNIAPVPQSAKFKPVPVGNQGVFKATGGFTPVPLVQPKPKPVAPATVPPVEKSEGIKPEDFYGRSAFGMGFPGIISPALTAHMGKMGLGPKPAGGWSEAGVPLDATGKPYKPEMKEKDFIRDTLADTFTGLTGLALHPMETVRGIADFALSIPGFLVGMLSAASKSSKEILDQVAIGQTLNLDKVYDVASKSMAEGAEFFQGSKEMLVGQPTEESSMVAEIAMAPLTGLSMAGHAIANHPWFEDSPNIRGAAKFAGDIAGLVAMGMLVHGKSGKAKLAKDVEEVVKKANDLKDKAQIVAQNPNEVMKQAEMKMLEVQKRQLELEAQAISNSISSDVLIREELGRQSEEVARAKVMPEDVLSRADLAETEFVSKKGNKYYKHEGKWYDASGKEVSNKFVIQAAEKGSKAKAESAVEEPKPVEPVEPTTPVEPSAPSPEPVAKLPIEPTPLRSKNKQSGKQKPAEPLTDPEIEAEPRIAIQFEGEKSPFFQDETKTFQFADLYKEKGELITEDVELYTGKLINDINRWYHGDGNIDIAATREMLNKFATRGNELREFFEDGTKHLEWMEMISEAATWAGKLKRKGEQVVEKPVTKLRKKGGGVQLNSMIPVDEIPKAVVDFLKTLGKIKPADVSKPVFPGDARVKIEGKTVSLSNIYRNRELWKATGFWLGKDGKWRYELGPEDVGLDIKKFITKHPNGIAGKDIRLVDLLGMDSKVFDALPELRHVRLNEDINKPSGTGEYNHNTRTITVSRIKDRSVLYHELQHAINNAVGAFRGGSATNVRIDEMFRLFDELIKVAKTDEAKREIEGLKDDFSRGQMGINEASESLIRVVEKRAPKYLDVFTKTVNGLLDRVRAYDKYRLIPGEMEARLVQERMSMSERFRKSEPPWKTLDRMLHDEAYPSIFRLDRGELSPYTDKFKYSTSGTKLYSGIDPVKAVKDIIGDINKILRPAELDKLKALGWKFKQATLNQAPGGPHATKMWRMIEPLPGNRRPIILEPPKEGGSGGTTLRSGIDPAEIIKAAKSVSDYVRKARAMKSFKPLEAAARIRREGVRTLLDKSGNIRKDFLAKLGDEGYRILQTMYLAKGASTRAAMMLKQMRKDVYRGLNSNEQRVLDTLILTDRLLDIAQYKTTKQFKFPKGMEPEKLAAYRELFGQIEKLSPERAAEIERRAASYFEWMKKPLQDMFEAGLISEQELADLSAHNYRKIKLVDIFDKRYAAKVGKKKRTVYDSGIEALANGRETDVYEPSSEVMALEVFNRAYGRIMNNLANQDLYNLAKSNPDNPFVKIRDKGKKNIPSGWIRVMLFENGERKSMWLHPEVAKEWIISNPEMSYKMSQTVRYLSGSPVLRLFATGINWGFAVANLPRDLMHAWFAARVYENGKWRSLYNPVAPVATGQLARDVASVFHDVVTRKGRYEDYINEGGGMEFLVHQGRLLQRGRHIEKPLDKFFNFMGWPGETSELLTRLAIRERALRRGKGGKEATFAARDYMDFGQGGTVVKAFDNAIPYLSAGVQGMRGFWRALKDNPAEGIFKLAQFGTGVVGLYIAMQKMHPKTAESLKGNIDMQNNLCIPLGDDYAFEDEYGQIRYPYFKIPLDPSAKFFKKFFEASTDKWLGRDVDALEVASTLKELSPVGTASLPPSISGVLGYWTNKDFWLNEDIWRETEKPFSWPASKEEYTPYTPKFFIDVGKATGASPERLRYTIEELTTSGTMWSAMLGEAYEKMTTEVPRDEKEKHWAMMLARMPVFKRFIGVTNPYSKHAEKIEKVNQEVTVKNFVVRRGLDTVVEGYLFKGTHTAKEVSEFIRNIPDPDMQKKMLDRRDFQIATKDLDNRSFWLRLQGMVPEARARIWLDEWNKSSEERKAELMQEMRVVEAVGGVLTSSFWDEVDKLNLQRARGQQ